MYLDILDFKIIFSMVENGKISFLLLVASREEVIRNSFGDSDILTTSTMYFVCIQTMTEASSEYDATNYYFNSIQKFAFSCNLS